MLKVKKKYQSEIIFFVLMMLICFTVFSFGKQKIFAATDGEVNLDAWSLTDFKNSEGAPITEVTPDNQDSVAEATLVYNASVESDFTNLVIPNAADFTAAYPNLERVWISKDTMRNVASNANKEDGTLSISDTKFIDEVTEEESDASVSALGADWSETFLNLDKIMDINLTGLDTSGVTDMHGMFKGCSKLSTLNVSGFNTSSVTDLSHIFDGCEALSTLTLNNFDTSKVTNMSYMFCGCASLTALDASIFGGLSADEIDFDTSAVTTMESMFYGCTALTTLDISDFDTGAVTTMKSMFYGCEALTTLDLSHFDTSNVSILAEMFYGCEALSTLTLSNFDTSKVTDMSYMFYDCKKLTHFDFGEYDEKDIDYNTSAVTNMSYMFYGCEALATLDLSDFDTSDVTTFSNMFYGCKALATLDLSSFDTKTATDLSYMFYGCEALTTLDLSHFDTSAVTTMAYMFYGCTGLEELDFGDYFDTSAVTTMAYMFYGCESLEELDLSHFDTSAVTTMAYMFYGCESLEELDLSHFDISEVEDFEEMFYNCYALAYLMLSHEILENLDEEATAWVLYSLFAIEEGEEPRFLFITSDDNNLVDLINAFDNEDNQMFLTTTLKVDGKNVKFADRDNQKEKYIVLYTTYALANIPEQILQDFAELLEEEKNNLIVDPAYEIHGWKSKNSTENGASSILQNVYTMETVKKSGSEGNEEGNENNKGNNGSKQNAETSTDNNTLGSGYSWTTIESSGTSSSVNSSSSTSQNLNSDNQTTNIQTSRQTESEVPEKLRTRKYLIGYDDGKIKPENYVTHAEFATIIYRLMNDGEEVNLNNLERIEDVKGTDWFGKAVAYLIDDSRKIINITEKKFRPQENIKGYEMMNIIHSVLKFYGVEQNSLYAQNLNSDITRAKMAEIIFNLLGRKSNQSQKIYSDLDKNHLEYKFLMDAAE